MNKEGSNFEFHYDFTLKKKKGKKEAIIYDCI